MAGWKCSYFKRIGKAFKKKLKVTDNSFLNYRYLVFHFEITFAIYCFKKYIDILNQLMLKCCEQI